MRLTGYHARQSDCEQILQRCLRLPVSRRSKSGVVNHIKRSITFTEKTRYLFEINKGIKQADSEVNPFLVNEDVEEKDRRVPFRNINVRRGWDDRHPMLFTRYEV